jgi:hypothetical protein
MADNFGTGNYDVGNKGASTAVGAASGWGAIAQWLAKGIAGNMGDSVDKGQEQQLEQTHGQNINAEHSSPFGVANQWGMEMFPGSEKGLAVNWKPLPVAQATTTQQPTDFKSLSPWAASYMYGVKS